MSFRPEPILPNISPFVVQDPQQRNWTPLFRHGCTFSPEVFEFVMHNMVRNPNINSTYLFRADIMVDLPFTPAMTEELDGSILIAQFQNFELKRVMKRTLIPRNALASKPLDETCLFYDSTEYPSRDVSMVVYLPHISCASESPFYHPAVYGICFLHIFSPNTRSGEISIHYCFFDSEPRSAKLERTAFHLLAALHKHGQGTAAGYMKRVLHDVVLPQFLVQNTYSRLKTKYAKHLIEGWVELTDPAKHVFEDLGIAAFLIELWNEIYCNEKFPGFVDIGCGNGLLVHILRGEGYSGWGFDARKRRSWSTYSLTDQENLKEMILTPFIIQPTTAISSKLVDGFKKLPTASPDDNVVVLQGLIGSGGINQQAYAEKQLVKSHNGIFPARTFIISNHADELTPWTALLATASKSNFIMIPCCSYNFCGERFRAPYPKKQNTPCSTYASLVSWVTEIATDCGWAVEKEMLRIPSTRNTALIGRNRLLNYEDIDLKIILEKYGGAAGWEKNALKLLSDQNDRKSSRNH